MHREELAHLTEHNTAILNTRASPRNYGSTSTILKMDGAPGDTSGSDALELTQSHVATPDSESRNRRITVSNVHIPWTRRKWHEYLKSFAQFRFRRSSPHSNRISTTKYTILTFIPKNLFEQFHRLANLYFLLIIILNFIPAIEVFGKEISWIPLSTILLVTAIKDAIEDIRRYRSDRELNNLPCLVYDFDQSKFVKKLWKDVRVGDFIRLGCDETIPADMLLLWSSDEDNLCYIQTSNLDGETNLKQRQVPVGIVEKLREEDKQSYDSKLDQDFSFSFNPLGFTGELFCEPPNNQIYQFKGFVKNVDGSVVPLSRNHLLLRGCILRNTDSIVGVVAYAGHESKAMLNISGTRAKRSKLERDINAEIFSQFVILFLLCFIGAILSGVWTGLHINKNIVFFPFTSDSANPALEGFVRFWSFVIIFQVIIPISLYVTMEIVKIAQVIFISWDLDMYYEPRDRPFQCKALNINEDLGQIKYVFSDKTGTLTENEMVFKCCSIKGTSYLHSLSEKGTSNSKPVSLEETDYPSSPSVREGADPCLLKDINGPGFRDSLIHDFMITMAICNTVVVSRQAGSNSAANGSLQPSLVYEAESPDEHALVEGACIYGYVLLSRSPSLIRLKTPHHGILEFEPLRVLEFSSDRKRMSVIVRDRKTGVITLYCKGADSVIYTRLSSSSLDPTVRANTQEHLNHYASLGLRTLCLAKRILSEETYQEWLFNYKKAELDLENRDDLQMECASNIERHLQLLGASGIEDRLQDGVQETIQSLRKAGMKVWVLTGDKKETAINIGYSSKLLTQDTEVLNLNAKSEEECLENLQDLITEMFPSLRRSLEASQASVLSNTVGRIQAPFRRLQSTLSWSNQSDKLDDSLIKVTSRKALVVDGATLEFAFKPRCKDLFVTVAKECYSVICCRATPLKKARVVELIKESETALTLAIGDGANDVSMIQMANVGIGIAGREGMQAVLASDFNMARFKYLKKLLLVHGHWCYSRLANMMLYFFYKNIMYAVLLFWYQLFNGFSGSNPIDGINLQIFNLVYTSMPIMVAAVADQDLKPKQLLTNEEHYRRGQDSRVYTRLKFWLVVLEAFYQSLVVFFVAYGAYYNSTIGIASFGFMINISVVMVASFHMALEFLHWTWIHHFFLWGSCLILFVFNYVYTAIDSQQRIMDTYFILQELSADARFWFVVLITPVIALFPRVIGKVVNQDAFPDSVLRARADERRGRKVAVDEDSLESAAT